MPLPHISWSSVLHLWSSMQLYFRSRCLQHYKCFHRVNDGNCNTCQYYSGEEVPISTRRKREGFLREVRVEQTLEGLGGFCGSKGKREEDGRYWKGGWRKEDCPGTWARGYKGQRQTICSLQDLKDLSGMTLCYKVWKRADGNSGWGRTHTFTERLLCAIHCVVIQHQKSSAGSRPLKNTKLKYLIRSRQNKQRYCTHGVKRVKF